MTPTMTARCSGTAGAATRAGAEAGGCERRDLDSRLVLETIVERRRAADAAEADLLALAVHYVDLHPVTDTHPAASWVPDRELAVTGDQVEVPLAGAGTPGVAQYAVEALGAALDVSYRSALGLVSEAVELCFRLPRLYELVSTGRLQAWKARTVARETTSLSPAAVEFVDRHLAVHGRGTGSRPTWKPSSTRRCCAATPRSPPAGRKQRCWTATWSSTSTGPPPPAPPPP